jgi:hypothetical protein
MVHEGVTLAAMETGIALAARERPCPPAFARGSPVQGSLSRPPGRSPTDLYALPLFRTFSLCGELHEERDVAPVDPVRLQAAYGTCPVRGRLRDTQTARRLCDFGAERGIAEASLQNVDPIRERSYGTTCGTQRGC